MEPQKIIQLKKFPIQIFIFTALWLGLFIVALLGGLFLIPAHGESDLAIIAISVFIICMGSLILLCHNLRLISNYVTRMTVDVHTVTIQFLDPLRDATKGKSYDKFVLSFKMTDNKIKMYYQRSSSKEILMVLQRKYLLDPNDWYFLEALVQSKR